MIFKTITPLHRAHMLAVSQTEGAGRFRPLIVMVMEVGGSYLVAMCPRKCAKCTRALRQLTWLRLGRVHRAVDESEIEVDDVTVTEPTAPATAEGLPQ